MASLPHGIDVSHHQGDVNWAEMYRLGIRFAFAKATEAETVVDSKFQANWRGIRQAGIQRSAYHFARPDYDSADDVEVFLNVVADAGGWLPGDGIWLDLESSTMTADDTAAFACEWGDLVHSALGVRAGDYSGHGYMSNSKYADLRNHFQAWWYPRYATSNVMTAWPTTFNPTLPSPNVWGGPPLVWQFSGSFQLPGASTSELVDANVLNCTVAELTKMFTPVPNVPDVPSIPPTPPTPPTSQPPEDYDMATIIVAYRADDTDGSARQYLLNLDDNTKRVITGASASGLHAKFGAAIAHTDAELNTYRTLEAIVDQAPAGQE